ncbi:DUF692 family protein [Niabella yanshanensis]|uniref:DUF692 family protein n=1 Tax=Niabella yanshanensis TaxID=577386 RepID=A0ABZ0W975_9BACT|nr:DUF692 family multinuclear iron-containing protein [Niabella yanshanensis]WQD39833.1 DUF692 family protein [Niabella yanshanensis]
MPEIFSSIACNLDNDILAACLPLFESEKVEAIEWAFDTIFSKEVIPAWFTELLQAYSSQGRLIGHGVFFSLFSGNWSKEQENWLLKLKALSKQFRFDHITEHFGFMTGSDFHKGAPLSVPLTASTMRIGIDRLQRIQDACNCPVGLENLAFACSAEEVKRHGSFLLELIESVNGFIILDLHNFYCQSHNFNIPFDTLIKYYPLDKVREIHISGGSWEPVSVQPARTIRRDTHDDAVPETVFGFLEKTLPRCPNLKFVVLEQLGNGLTTPESRLQFQKDFYRMRAIVQSAQKNKKDGSPDPFLPPMGQRVFSTPTEDPLLGLQQQELSDIFENAESVNDAIRLLKRSSLAQSAWKIEYWDEAMLETAINIAQKWKNGFD